MTWESSKEEFVENTTLFDVQIILNLAVAPIGEVLGMVVGLIEVRDLHITISKDVLTV